MAVGKISAVALLVLAGTAAASPTLQFDVNAIRIQARDGSGANSAFGGLMHTGSVAFSFQTSTTYLAGIDINGFDAGFTGSLTDFTGAVNLVNGQVTGGNLAVTVNGGTDSYVCDIVPNLGQVTTYVGGGFKIDGLSYHGHFSDGQFGNVDVSPFAGNDLPGSFLQFNFDPNASGGGFADMDLFVQAVPLPPAIWGGLAGLGGVMVARRVRRSRA